jgi:tripartite-type tricarboxylate transporter receptor subunit TctC
MPFLEAPTWVALFAPAGVSISVADRLGSALRAALSDAGVRAKIEQLGALAPSEDRIGPQYATRFIDAEIRRWTSLVREVNVPPP